MGPGWFETFLKHLDGAVDAGILMRLAGDYTLRAIADGNPSLEAGADFRIAQAEDVLASAHQSMIANDADPALLGELDQLRTSVRHASEAALATGLPPPDASPDIADASSSFGDEPDDPDGSTDFDIVGPWPP